MPEYVKPWSEIDDRILREISGSGQPARIAADLLGRSRNAILGRAHRLKISFGREFSYKQPVNDQRIDNPKPIKLKPNRPPEEALVYSKTDRPETATKAFGVLRELVDLEPNHCRWPCEEVEGTHQFCCADQLPGRSYCIEHYKIAFSDRPLRRIRI